MPAGIHQDAHWLAHLFNRTTYVVTIALTGGGFSWKTRAPIKGKPKCGKGEEVVLTIEPEDSYYRRPKVIGE